MQFSYDALEKVRINNYKIKNADKLMADVTKKYEKTLAVFNSSLVSDDRPDKKMIEKLKALKDQA